MRRHPRTQTARRHAARRRVAWIACVGVAGASAALGCRDRADDASDPEIGDADPRPADARRAASSTPEAVAPEDSVLARGAADAEPRTPTLDGDDAEAIEAVAELLEAHVRRWGLSDPDNTWALTHALLALGADATLPDGTPLPDAILATASTRRVGDRAIPAFEGRSRDGTPREPHGNQVLQALLGAGVSLDRSFEAGGETWTVADLHAGALWAFEPPAGGRWHVEAWTLKALAHGTAAGGTGPTFENRHGRAYDARRLAVEAAAHLNREQAFLERVRDAGEPLVKRREGVHDHACGGLHGVEGPALWLGDPMAMARLESEMTRASETLAFRLGAERDVYARARSAAPDQDLLVTIQELKFYGHWLEATATLEAGGVSVDREAVGEALRLLATTVARLDRSGALDRMAQVRAQREQAYLDLIGDAAHAAAGIRAWLELGIAG